MDSSYFFFFYFDVVGGIACLTAAWFNLVKKRITRVGPDGVIFTLYRMFRREKVLKFNLRENPVFIQRMGTVCLIIGFGFINAAMENLKVIWPYIHLQK